MSKKYLGEEIDIHGGGEDLVFPHHENEIAQSEAASGHVFSHYWMHNAFLNINNVKMSKSLGNFLLVRDISKQYDLSILRFFMLSAHYRSPLNFSPELMEAAKSGLERIQNGLVRLRDEAENCAENGADQGAVTGRADWDALRAAALDMAGVLGIEEPKKELLDADIEALIEERQAARKAKNYARADQIRAELADTGILLEDTKEGVKWKRK